jgi:hypothetical protein
MAKKKAVKKKSTKSVKVPRARQKEVHNKGPEYMVQLGDPKMLRKDILESLREVIIFMQGYEKFRKIQEEKVALFNKLKMDLKEVHSLIDNKVRKFLPKGKLAAIDPLSIVDSHEEPKIVTQAPLEEVTPTTNESQGPAPMQANTELDELESQLKDIEGQLRGMG